MRSLLQAWPDGFLLNKDVTYQIAIPWWVASGEVSAQTLFTITGTVLAAP